MLPIKLAGIEGHTSLANSGTLNKNVSRPRQSSFLKLVTLPAASFAFLSVMVV